MLKKKKVYILDTNIILDNVFQLKNISDNGENIIVIPEIVLIELENIKKNNNDLAYQARTFIRMLNDSKEIKTIQRNIGKKNEYSIVKFKSKSGIFIDIFAKKNYEIGEIYNQAEINDKKIIEIAEMVKEYYVGEKVIFLSLDAYARIFAKLKKIATETLRKNLIEKKDYQLIKRIVLDLDTFNNLKNHMNIVDIDKDYSKENYSYIVSNTKNNNTKYFIVVNKQIYLIDENNDFKGIKIVPRNIEQRFFIKAILDNRIDICIVDARAGSGKTLLSLTTAMKLIKTNSQFNKIVYVRNSIESVDKGAEVGFLSGNDEKFRIYNMALYDNLEYLAVKELNKKKLKKNNENEELITSNLIANKVEELKTNYNIQILWPGEGRGRTFSNTIFIFDEWTNASDSTSQLMLSRLDETCKAIVIGSSNQIDNIYLNKQNNGLVNLLSIANKYKKDDITFFATIMPKSVRGKFAQFADEVY